MKWVYQSLSAENSFSLLLETRSIRPNQTFNVREAEQEVDAGAEQEVEWSDAGGGGGCDLDGGGGSLSYQLDVPAFPFTSALSTAGLCCLSHETHALSNTFWCLVPVHGS